ncbi:DUF779 domain-containing protein [Aureispira anguillae]|uniref:DUF779 domain-containing protein n=1 Tax=Aureispira anguillae TaxID=2864201 RepID=A0A915YCW6_9BACT|nr:DUF779 domain-containing protein [Aureispira anguillae]BDS10755.1 DUF779 domain-containing protein [Aureispira anguillae]
MIPRVLITPEAKSVIDQLRLEHGELIFHQSAGCCDGSAPMCFPKGELMLNETDIWLGDIHNCGFFMSQDQFEYWKYTQLTIDVTQGRGSSFSLEIPMGIRFITKSRLFSTDEISQLSPIRNAE